MPEHFDREIIAAVHRAAAVLAENGAVVEELSLPHTAPAWKYITCSAPPRPPLTSAVSTGLDTGRSARGTNVGRDVQPDTG